MNNKNQPQPAYNLKEIYDIIQQSIEYLNQYVNDWFAVETNNNPDTLFDEIYSIMSKIITIGTNKSPMKSNIACKAGCASCCTQKVPVTPLEALVIAKHLQSQFPISLPKIKNNIRHNAEKYKNLKPNHLGTKISCALLDNKGYCIAHAKRPARCQGYLSSSSAKCRDYHFNSGEFPPIDGFSSAWSKGVHSALAHIFTQHNLDCNYYELHSAVLCALDVENPFIQWLNAKPIFENCLKSAANPETLWTAPQSDGTIICLKHSGNTKNTQKSINIKII